eukprot:scaffold304105_cov32-Tisochrysis_lutea.AAC.2
MPAALIPATMKRYACPGDRLPTRAQGSGESVLSMPTYARERCRDVHELRRISEPPQRVSAARDLIRRQLWLAAWRRRWSLPPQVDATHAVGDAGDILGRPGTVQVGEMLGLEVVGRETFVADMAIPLARLGPPTCPARLGSRVEDFASRGLKPDHLHADGAKLLAHAHRSQGQGRGARHFATFYSRGVGSKRLPSVFSTEREGRSPRQSLPTRTAPTAMGRAVAAGCSSRSLTSSVFGPSQYSSNSGHASRETDPPLSLASIQAERGTVLG